MTDTPQPTATQLYDQALLALASKDRATARQQLATVVVLDPRHEEAWLQLSALMDTVDQSIECLQHVIALNPAHAKARHWLRMARQAQARAAASASVPEAEPIPEPPMDDPEYVALDPADQPVPRLGRYLLDFRFVTAVQLAAALATQADWDARGQARFLGDILISQGALTVEYLNFALREQARIRAEAARAQPESALD